MEGGLQFLMITLDTQPDTERNNHLCPVRRMLHEPDSHIQGMGIRLVQQVDSATLYLTHEPELIN
jgi:hypothetical protein